MRNHFGTLALGVGLLMAVSAAGTAQEKSASSPGDGIKVHGHWTIEVRRPDGTLVSRDEVENALFGGEKLLAGLLAHRFTDHIWSVTLHGSDVIAPCVDQSGYPAGCNVTEARSIYGGPNYSKNLTLNLPTDDSGVLPAGTLELSGSITAPRSFSIGLVQSGVSFQGPGMIGDLLFTRKLLATPIPVVEGQIIQVKAVFSFS